MKTLIEYEASDISFGDEAAGTKMDPVHSFLMGQIFIVALGGLRPTPEDPPDDPVWPVKRLIAGFLNSAAKAGISITKSELPSAITAGMADKGASA